MYYIEPNIVRPLTNKWQLSLADVLGASRVVWFVSHWWGLAFTHTMSALTCHTSATHTGGAQSYWICTFSNNQWNLKEEIPGKLEDSSFFQTLLSGFCQGVAMVLDDVATPLTRSWCLFEYLHAVELSQSQQFENFQGLRLCHSSGILDLGFASVEVALGLGERLTSLRLEEATASRREDKQMIDALVIKKMGSFANINRVLKSAIERAMKAAAENTQAKFEGMRSKLKEQIEESNLGDEADEPALAPPQAPPLMLPAGLPVCLEA